MKRSISIIAFLACSIALGLGAWSLFENSGRLRVQIARPSICVEMDDFRQRSTTEDSSGPAALIHGWKAFRDEFIRRAPEIDSSMFTAYLRAVGEAHCNLVRAKWKPDLAQVDAIEDKDARDSWIQYLARSNRRADLVDVLATIPVAGCGLNCIEGVLLAEGTSQPKQLDDPVGIVFDAYDRSADECTMLANYLTIRRIFRDQPGIFEGRDEYVRGARRWYDTNRDRLQVCDFAGDSTWEPGTVYGLNWLILREADSPANATMYPCPWLIPVADPTGG